MTTDLWMAVAAVGLTWILILAAATPKLLKNPAWALGPRDEDFELDSILLKRLQRTRDNMMENLPLFLGLVFVVHLAGRAGATTALGAQTFVAARLIHAALYIGGVPYLRTLAWCGSVFGLALLLLALF
jgi:uncharacterized MAPEG superfamily protein